MFRKKKSQSTMKLEVVEGKEAFDGKAAKAMAEMKAQAHKFIDEIDGPFAVIAPKDVGDGVSTSNLIAIAGNFSDTGLMLTGLYAARIDYLREMAQELPEDMMDSLTKLDHDLREELKNA